MSSNLMLQHTVWQERKYWNDSRRKSRESTTPIENIEVHVNAVTVTVNVAKMYNMCVYINQQCFSVIFSN
jgi:hypothetical protein